MLNIFYDPDEPTGSVVRHAPAWAESPVTTDALGFSGSKASRRRTVTTRNPFRQL
jgi:hypothetical protein